MLNHYRPYHKQTDTLNRELLIRPLGVVEKHLSTRTYFVGERITLADLTAGFVMVIAYENVVGKELREAHPNILRHYETIRNHPLLKDIWGPTEYCETPKQYVPPAKPAKEEKPKEPKAPKAPKAEKAPKKEAEEEEEPDVPPEPKAKNPLDDLPKSNFNLEDWKRAYSNMDTRGAGGSLEWFYDK
jgi:elongation factor 1-gamma